MFTVLDKSTGKPLFTINASVSKASVYADMGYSVYVGELSDNHQMIDGSKTTIADKPNAYAVYDYVNKVWVDDIEAAKSAVLQMIDDVTQTTIYDRYPQPKQANMQALATQLQAIKNGSITLLDDSFQPVIDGAGNYQFIPARDWTTAEELQWVSIQKAWAWIKSVRALSSNAFYSVHAAITVDAVLQIKDDFVVSLSAF